MTVQNTAATQGNTTVAAEPKPVVPPTTGEPTPVVQPPAVAEVVVTPVATLEGKPASKDDQVPPVSKAPEKYSLTLPDGGRIDDRDLKVIEAVARAQNWTNDEAQARVTAHADAIDAQSVQFRADTEADAVYGGANLPETLKLADAALDKLRPKGTPRGDALRGLLHKSGFGNHLEVVSLLADLGKLMAEDGNAGGVGNLGATSDVATLLYGGGDKA